MAINDGFEKFFENMNEAEEPKPNDKKDDTSTEEKTETDKVILTKEDFTPLTEKLESLNKKFEAETDKTEALKIFMEMALLEEGINTFNESIQNSNNLDIAMKAFKKLIDSKKDTIADEIKTMISNKEFDSDLSKIEIRISDKEKIEYDLIDKLTTLFK